MLGIDMTSQVDSALERPRATDAGERSETGVLATVSDEVRRLTERLPALTTCVGLFSYTYQIITADSAL